MMCSRYMMRIVSLLSLLWSLVEVHCQTAPFILFNGTTVPNHGYVDLGQVGDDGSTGADSVQCHTDLETCCTGSQGSHRGDWFAPGGTTRLPFSGDPGDIYEQRVAQRVDLRRRNNANSPVGIYRCGIHTSADLSVRATVYVGLYTASGGDVIISGNLTYDSDQLTLTCISTSGPATTVSWTRDNVNIAGEQNETVLNDPVTAQYTHTLNISTAGEYTCTVANDKPSSATSNSITVTGPPPPTDVAGVQDGPTSIRVTWTPPDPLDGVTGYSIHYTTGGGGSGNQTVSGGNTMSHTLSDLTNGETYTISIVATSNTLSSDTVTANMPVGLIPGIPVLTISSTTTTSITLSVDPTDSVMETYAVRWTSEMCSITEETMDKEGSPDTITITGLEEGIRYTITVTATNSAGSEDSTTITGTTSEAVPSGAPNGVEEVSTAPNSITVRWGEVDCLLRNGIITGFTAQAVRNGVVVGTASVGGDARQATISGLESSTEYSVQLAAVNSAGIGLFSSPITVMTSEGLTVSATSSSTTSISVSWELQNTLTASGYTISYTNTNNTQCFTDSRSGISASGTSHTVDNLEEVTQYSITVTATLNGGGTLQGSTVAATLTVVPSAAPTDVKVSFDSSTSITVQWGSVPCIHQNGEIAGYSVQYVAVGSSEPQSMVVLGDSNGGTTTISGLTSRTMYTVQVAAVNTPGTGLYSTPLPFETPNSVYLSLNGEIIPNHGYVAFSDIGSNDPTALLCNTDRGHGGSGNSGGDWSAPDGTRVGRSGINKVPGFVRNRGSMVVGLKRTTGTPAQGMYHCSILDAEGNDQIVYIGLYNTGNGDISVESFTLGGASPQFTLTCISTGGPTTTVQWTRDNELVTEGTETVLNDPETARYQHRLSVTSGGEYTCSVTNTKPSDDSQTFTVTAALPPTDVSAVQEGVAAMNVSWTPPSPLGDTTGYRIHYTNGGGSSGSQTVSGGSTNTYLLTDLLRQATYTLSITAISEHLPSTTVNVGDPIKLVLPPSTEPVVDMDSVETTTSTITISWAAPSDVTGSQVSWELTDTTRRRGIHNAEGGTSGRLPGDQNLYTILRLRSGTSYDIIVTVFNPAGSSFTTFTHSTASDGEGEGENNSSSTVIAVLGGVLGVVIVTAISAIAVLVMVIAFFMRKLQRAKESTNTGLELSEFSGKNYLGSDGFQTASNEAYNVVRQTGRTTEGDYEVPNHPSASSSQPATTGTAAVGDNVYEPI